MTASPSIISKLAAPNIILTSMTGRISAAVCAASEAEFLKLLQSTSDAVWMVDVLGISGFDANAVTAGSKWFAAFNKASQNREILYVTNSGPTRMVVHSLAFAAGLNVKIFSTLQEACASIGLSKIGLVPVEQYVSAANRQKTA